MTHCDMRRKEIEVPSRNFLPSWKIERKYSFGEFLDGWLEKRRVVSCLKNTSGSSGEL